MPMGNGILKTWKEKLYPILKFFLKNKFIAKMIPFTKLSLFSISQKKLSPK